MNRTTNSNKGFKTKGRLYDKTSKKAAHTLRKLRKSGRGGLGISIATSLEG